MVRGMAHTLLDAQQDYEHADRENPGAASDVADLTKAGEALGMALAQVKRALDRCNLTGRNSFDPLKVLECVSDDLPMNGQIIDLAAQDVLTDA